MTKQDIHPAALESQEKESVLSGVDFDFKIENGNLLLTLSHDGSDAGVKLQLNVHSDKLLDKLESAIPGDWDKGIIAILKAAIANIKA